MKIHPVSRLYLITWLVLFSACLWADDLKSNSVPKKALESEVADPAKPMEIHADRDADVARIVGVLLEHHHYLQTPITAEISQHWLNNYLISLDSQHMFFLKNDIDEFKNKYGNNLGDLLLHNEELDASSAIAPAFEIFKRYMQRVEEKVKQVDGLVQQKIDFNIPETYTIPSDKSDWLADVATSDDIWHKQIKSDFLQMLLEKAKGKTTAADAGTFDETVTDKMMEKVQKRYHSLLRVRREMEDQDVMRLYINALTHAYDPHSDYFPPDDADSFAITSIKLQLTGIGAVLRDDDGYATIEDLMVGGPAEKDKRLQPGDRIFAVGQDNAEPVEAVNMQLGKVVNMIRGKKGTMVKLIIIPAGTSDTSVHKEIVLKRDVVQLKESSAKADVIDHTLENGKKIKIGVIDLPGFYDHTARDIGKLLIRLRRENVNGVILDMRNNGGGLLDQAIDLTGLFVKHEPVVQSRDPKNDVDVLRTGDVHQVWAGPLIALVNKASASATEIVAGALQDYGRAVIVGDKSTHGKGTVQTLVDLNHFLKNDDGRQSELKMTVQKFYRISGGSTQEKGVVPDIVLPSVLDALELGETTLPYYLRYDTINPVPFGYYNLVSQYLPVLQKNSTQRVASSKDFSYVKEDIEYYKQKVQNKTISLNFKDRLAELNDLKQKRAARKSDLEARQKTRDKVYELTLDMVDQDLPLALRKVKPKPKLRSLDPDSDEDTDDQTTFDPATLSYDPQLSETVSIMGDYIHMLESGTTPTATTASGN